MTIEGLRLRILKLYRKIPAKRRKKKLKEKEFTIISNNCWGGMTYECYDLRKDTPTIGLYFMSHDYIRFVSNLKYYLSQELRFIEPKESAYFSEFGSNESWCQYPKALLDDVEVVFMHYHTKEEAKKHWERRVKRIHWDKLLVKFNDQNGCTRKDVEEFLSLPYENKIFFTCKEWEGLENRKEIVKIHQISKQYIMASHEPFGSNYQFNVTDYLNRIFG